MRAHAGFLRRGTFWEGASFIGSYLWRWPAAFALDTVLHLKTPLNNWLHPIDIYRDRLERTFLRAREDIRLSHMNAYPAAAPYLVLNGNLTNWGAPRSGADKAKVLAPYNFEFTRDWSGSDGIGYADTRVLGRRVLAVTEDEVGAPSCVRVSGLSRATLRAAGPPDPDPDRRDRWIPDPGELSSGVAASGAAKQRRRMRRSP